MKTITLPIDRYDELIERNLKLIYLESYGVDNWEGYGLAMEAMDEDREDNKDEDK